MRPHPRTRKPVLGSQNFTTKVDPSLAIITIFLVCLIHAYMTTSYHKHTALQVMKFTFLVDPSLVIIAIYLVCLIYG